MHWPFLPDLSQGRNFRGAWLNLFELCSRLGNQFVRLRFFDSQRDSASSTKINEE